MLELTGEGQIGQVWEAQWERDAPCPEYVSNGLFFDCHMVTPEAESESKAGPWHDAQEMSEEDVPAQDRWELEKHAKSRQPPQASDQEAERQQQKMQALDVQTKAPGQTSQEEQGMQEERKSWGKVQQAAQEAARPQGKHRRTARKLLNTIQIWGTQAQGRQWEQPVGIWWHMQHEEHALSWVYGGVEAEVKAFLTPELQQPGGDRKLYVAAKREATEAARKTGWQSVLMGGVEVQTATEATGEHMGVLCREAVGAAAAATEEGAHGGLKEAVKGITQSVAA